MGSGWARTWVGLAVVAALLATAQTTAAQPVRSALGLSSDEPYGGYALPTDGLMTPMSPVPPRTAYQPPRRDPSGIPYQPDLTLPNGAPIPVPQSRQLRIQYIRRYGTPQTQDAVELPDGTTRILFTGGVIVNVSNPDGTEQTEFATDNAVLWVKGAGAKAAREGVTTGGEGKTEVEAYLSGNVVIRSTTGTKLQPITQTLRAEEVYYDAERHRAIALRADLEMAIPNVPENFHLKGAEVRRLDLENWEMLTGSANASKLPSDPALRLDAKRFSLSQRKVVRRNIFGIPYRDFLTGAQIETDQQIVTGNSVVTRLGGVPVFYLPRIRFDANDPVGPLTGFSFSQNRIFGSQVYATFDAFELLALRPPPGHEWRANVDYLSKRGPAGGTDYTYSIPGERLFDPAISNGHIKLYGISEEGFDVLGGFRGPEPFPQGLRGRAMWRHQQEILEGLYFQGQFAYLSDKNFLEQYYKNEFDRGPNQESFGYLAWQRRNFGATLLGEARFNREWVTETNWLPRVDGHWIGQTFLDDLFVYSARTSAGYAQLRPTEISPFPVLSTDRRTETGRFNLWQELSVPFSLGPVKLAPYGVLDLTEYTSDLSGNEIGRIYGGGGTRASIPFSRIYSEVNSDLLNLRGLHHKVVVGGNYRYTRTNEPYTRFPMLDRLNDDAVDQAYRSITPLQSLFVPGPNGLALMNSPVFNPQLYAIRRAVENRIDTLDNNHVLQADLRQRFQTKRGYPGLEHTVDFFTLDTSVSFFPEATRDNFGHPFSFLEYDALWNLGDRVSFASTGWFEPYQGGSRYWNAGMYLNRSDRTNVYLGYRHTDPLNSKAVVLAMGYQLSNRYYVNLASSYDFGLQQALSNSLALTRTGTDLSVTVGFTYNALVNNFGFQFLVVPNLAAALGGRFTGAPVAAQQVSNRR